MSVVGAYGPGFRARVRQRGYGQHLEKALPEGDLTRASEAMRRDLRLVGECSNGSGTYPAMVPPAPAMLQGQTQAVIKRHSGGARGGLRTSGPGAKPGKICRVGSMHAGEGAGELSCFRTACRRRCLTAGWASPKLTGIPLTIAHSHPEPALSRPVGT